MTEDVLNWTLDTISRWSADFGGTEIYNPLKEIFNQKPIENYQKVVFLLTDGSVSHPEQIIKLVEQNCNEKQNRVFTVGIGNGCSSYLVTKSAKSGQGKHVFIKDSEDVEAKVVDL